MRRTTFILVVAVFGGACLPAFAPSIRATRQHAALSPAAADTTCMGCHPSQAEMLAGPSVHGGPPVVPTWMINDRRGCVGCHDVLEPRR